MAIESKKSDSGKEKGQNLKASRRATGLNVIISIVVATALLIVINVISNKKSCRYDMETFGRYGMSDAAGKILDQIDQPVRLTSIYTSTKPDRKPQEYLPRLRDMMDEMARRKDNVTVVNVTSDRAKAEVLGRLRRTLDESASDYRGVIKDFQVLDGKQGPQYERLARQWAEYPSGGWLEQFGMPKGVEAAMGAIRKRLRKTAIELRRDLSASALPDYPDMVGRVEKTLKEITEAMTQISGGLRSLSSLPEKAEKAKPGLTAAAGRTKTAITRASIGISVPDAPNPQKILKSFAADIRTAADSALLTATGLERFAGGGYVHAARSWRLEGATLPRRYRRLADALNKIADQGEGLLQVAAKADSQKQFIDQTRRKMPRHLDQADALQIAVNKLLNELTKLDEHTKKVFARVKQADYLQTQIKPMAELLGRAGKVKPLPEHLTELIENTTQDNIVLIEIGEKTGVVGFDEVWPLAAGRQMEQDDEDDEDNKNKRVFHGDSAVCAKMLSMTAEPFAEVVLTFFEPVQPPYLRQRQPPVVGPLPSQFLRTVRERLEKANLVVTEWNIAGQKPTPEAKEGRRQVLLILPPPEPSPMPQMPGMPKTSQWSPDEVAKVRKVIDGGTPAVFLAGYFWPRYMGRVAIPARYGFGDYLRNDWGIDVKTALRVIQTRPDPLNPGTFELLFIRWSFMHLSSFTDHVIGRPLKSRRMYWYNVCPITDVADSKTGTVIEDILTVSEDRGEMWATAQADQLERKMYLGHSSGIKPDADTGDLLPPFAVAVKAERKIEKGRNVNIVVLGVSTSFDDRFVNMRVPQLKSDETIGYEPPPVADIDLLINSIYHLSGRDEYIGAGPSIIEPIEQIASGTMLGVKILCGLAAPMLMFAVGIVVMIVRKR